MRISCKDHSGAAAGFRRHGDLSMAFSDWSLSQTGRCYRANEAICVEGDEIEAIFQVMTGTVKIYKMSVDGKRQIVRFLQAGDWLADFAGKAHRHTAEALGDVSVRSWPKSDLAALMRKDAAVAVMMYENASQSLAAAEEQLLVLGRKSATEKVATFLLSLVKPSPCLEGRGERAPVIDIPMQRSDIADYLGLSVETVCRKITEFAKCGFITARTATHLQVENIGALRRIASADSALLH